MIDRNPGERTTNLRGNAIGKMRRRNQPEGPTERRRRGETTKKAARRRKNLLYAIMAREQQNWEARTKKEKQRCRDRGREIGKT